MNAATPARAGSGTLALQREIARALAAPRRVSQLLASVTMVLARATSSVRAEAWIIAPGGDRALLLAHWGEDRGAWASLHERHERAELARGEGVIGSAWSSGRAAHGQGDGPSHRTLAFVVPLASAPCMIIALYGELLDAADGVLDELDAIGVQVGAMLARFELERAVRESERRQRQIIDALPVALIAIDREGRIVDCSRAAERMLGSAAEEMLGRSAIDVLAPLRWRSRFERGLRAMSGLHRITARTRVPIRTGSGERIVELRIGSIDDPARGLALAIDDVTDRVAEERSLRRGLRAARRELGERDDFSALLAHELRNPLAAIVMARELIASGDVPAMEHAREVIARQTEHAVRLIDDLLDVTRARRGRLTVARARVSLRRVIDLALELSMPALRERGHRLTVNASVRGVWLVGDEARLAQVVSNLLSNAARYTPRGGNVELEVSASIDEVVVRVRDDGIGMSRTLCETAFEPFRRGAQTGAGLGLGLSIVKSLVELHGGRVSVSSEGPGTGSTFEVRLPRWRRRYAS